MNGRALSLLLAAVLLAVPGCRPRHEGAVKVTVIGGTPKVEDPALVPLSESDAVLVASVGQGLVQLDAAGNIVSGLAERWNVSDDGLSYIFRIAATNWPGGRKVTAQQVARILKRSLATASVNRLKDAAGAIDDVVAMTDRVIEIRLRAPRPNLLNLLAQPEFGIVRNGIGTGPFQIDPKQDKPGELALSRESLLQTRKAPRARRCFSPQRPPSRLSASSSRATPTWCLVARSRTFRSHSRRSCPAERCGSTRRQGCSGSFPPDPERRLMIWACASC